MDDCETTRKQVLDLRVLELKDVLDYVEINAEGSKKALQVSPNQANPKASTFILFSFYYSRNV